MGDFEQETVRRLANVDRRLASIEKNAVGPALAELPATFHALPALRALWLCGDTDNAGSVYDMSSQGRTLSVGAGTPTVTLASSLIPYMAYGGASYHTRASEAGLNISGTEANVDSSLRGLTVGAWYWANSVAADSGLLSKWNTTGNQRGHILYAQSLGPHAAFIVSSDGTTSVGVVNSLALTTSAWHFQVGRFTPSTELAVFDNYNGSTGKTTNTTSIPASIFASTADFEGAAWNAGGNKLTGRIALAFLCASALPDALISYIFGRTRVLFGV